MQFVQQFKLWPLHSVFLLPYFLHKVCRYVIHRKTENMQVDKRSRQALSWIWHWTIVATGLLTFFSCFFIEGMITRGPWYLLVSNGVSLHVVHDVHIVQWLHSLFITSSSLHDIQQLHELIVRKQWHLSGVFGVWVKSLELI